VLPGADPLIGSGVDEAAAVIELRTGFPGNIPDIAFRVAEAETAPPTGLLGLIVQLPDVVELTHLFVCSEDGRCVVAVDREGETAKLAGCFSELRLGNVRSSSNSSARTAASRIERA
jgi:hypothetical protein